MHVLVLWYSVHIHQYYYIYIIVFEYFLIFLLCPGCSDTKYGSIYIIDPIDFMPNNRQYKILYLN